MAAKNTSVKHADVRYAMASRDWGLRRLRRLTFGIAGAGAAGAILLAIGFDVHAHQAQTGGAARGGHAQAPGRSQNTGGGQQGGQLQAPVNNPLPAGGSGQVVSGGS